MKTSRLTYALIAAGILAVAAALAKAHVEVNLGNVAGYSLAVGLIALIGMEYRAFERR